MSPVCANEAKLEGILDAIRLGLAAQACEADPVVNALRAVLVPDVKHDGLFAEVEQEPRSSRVISVPASSDPRPARQEGEEGEKTHWAVTARTSSSAHPLRRHRGVV